nr:hypothetical protein Iba_chr08eCG11240 [Ipomoea batatas]
MWKKIEIGRRECNTAMAANTSVAREGGAVCVLPSQDTGRVISTPDHRSISSGETQRQDMAICMLVQLSEYQINKLK